jgi:hypothetical protein
MSAARARWLAPAALLPWLLLASLVMPATRGLALAQSDPSQNWVWTREAMPFARPQQVSRGRDGTLWIRFDPDGADETLAIGPEGLILARGATRDLIAANLPWLRAEGSLRDFWSVDLAGRVWLGPAYHDGRAWRVLARDGQRGESHYRFERQALLDAEDQAWVPFEVKRECGDPEGCVIFGLQSFGPEGPRSGAVELARVAEADAFGLPWYFLLPGAGGANAAVAALDRLALYRLPVVQAIALPLLGAPAPGELRNAGYATLALRDESGRPQVFTWVEIQGRETITPSLLAQSWDERRSSWTESVDLTDAPFAPGGAGELRLVAGDRSPDGSALWLAASNGGLAERSQGAWTRRFGPDEIGLGSADRVLDLAVGNDGAIWLVATDGVHRWGPERRRFSLALPWLGRR